MSDNNKLATVEHVVFSREKIELIKSVYAAGSTDAELELFIEVCKRTRLDPFKRQICMVKRWDSAQDKTVMSIQVTIDGFRSLADETGKYAGQMGPFWCGKDGKWQEVWLGVDAPFAARVGVLRSDFKEVLWAVARYDAYVQTKKGGGANHIWQKMPDNQLAKCAEALALRKAFPAQLSGLYTEDEMGQADNETRVVNVTPFGEREPRTAQPDPLVSAAKQMGAVEKHAPAEPTLSPTKAQQTEMYQLVKEAKKLELEYPAMWATFSGPDLQTAIDNLKARIVKVQTGEGVGQAEMEPLS